MKEGYIKREDRKKILLLGDDLRTFSGVATMCKEIVVGTAHRFNWVQIGASIQHPEAGKIIDVSQSVNDEIGIPDAYVKIIPNNGYGDMGLLRHIIRVEHPDAIFIFTDPRYWMWLFSNEREIRQQMPIIYYNIWDDLPYPMYNKPFYESCDALFAISKQTYNINKQVLGDKVSEHILRYIPHGVSKEFNPVPFVDIKLFGFKKKIWGEHEPKFKLLYNARNIGRKHTSDLMMAWRLFCENIGDEAKDCELVLHTDIVDNAGTDLKAVADMFCKDCNIRFLNQKISTAELNLLYNACDAVVLASSNEGWGLSLTEALNTGKMIIANVTGGMQDQMRFEDSEGNWIDFTKDFPSNHNGDIQKHGAWAVPVFPSNRSLAGSPVTPYIYDDRVRIEDLAEAIAKVYEMDPRERDLSGSLGYAWATSDEAGFTAAKMCERMIEGIEATFTSWKPRAAYELLEATGTGIEMVDYDPINYKLDNE